MAVLTGRSGQFYVDGVRVARCTSWDLDETRPVLDSTTVDSWVKTCLPGRRSGTGNAKLLYDPEDTAAAAFFNSILEPANSASEIAITAMLDDANGVAYPLAVLVSSASHAVSRGEAQQRDIAFKLSDVGLELEITGSAQAGKTATQLYTAQVYGLSGAWVYAWSITSGPTISDPTAPSTNVNFPDLGTFTLTVTATLGTTVLTDSLTVDVIDVPLMWISRPTTPQIVGGNRRPSATCFDTVNQTVFHAGYNLPDVSLGSIRNVITKFNYAGNRQITKALGGLVANETVMFMCVLNDGSLFVVTGPGANTPRWMKISADLSTITYQFRATAGMNWGGATYDPISDRIYVSRSTSTGTTGDRPYIAYITASTGTMVKVDITAVPSSSYGTSNTSSCPPLITQSGKVLVVFPGPGNPSTNSFFVVEFNKDLLNGGLYNPTQTVEHQFSTGFIPTNTGGFALVESENHVIAISTGSDDMLAFLLNKSDYSFVSHKRFGTQSGGLFAGPYISCAYCYAGEVVIASDRFFNQGGNVMKFAADLSAGISYIEYGGSTGSGTLSNNAGWYPTIAESGWGNGAGFDPVLGLVALNVQTDKFYSAACFFRVNYGSFRSLQYDTVPDRWMAVQPKTLVNFTSNLSALTFSVPRSYTGALTAPTLGASAATIANETLIAYQEYTLAS
jgi:hypothetical protein